MSEPPPPVAPPPAAKRAGMSVQAFATHVLANPGQYSEAMRKKAQFAKNATKFGN